GRGEIGFRLRNNVGIDDEGDFLGSLGGGVFSFGSEAVALPECLHLKAVDLVDDSVELVLEFRGGLDVYAAGQHQIDRAIEVSAGGEKITLLVVGLPRRVCPVDLLDKSP